MQVRWLKKALENLDSEAQYIAEDNPQAAGIVVTRIRDSVNQLADDQSLGRPGRVVGTRELVVQKTRYIIPYRVRNNCIEVLRVFHTSRKLPHRW
jgi:toxin ParE1/3/4